MTAKEKYLTLVKLRLKKPSDASETHFHHVVPRCMNTGNDLCVRLSVQEHTLAHFWLWKRFRSGKKQFRVHAQEMFAAYKGLRNTWFGPGYYRYRFQIDEAFAEYEKSALARIQAECREY